MRSPSGDEQHKRIRFVRNALLIVVGALNVIQTILDSPAVLDTATTSRAVSSIEVYLPSLREQAPTNSGESHNSSYLPSKLEKYIFDHTADLGYDQQKLISGCAIWKDSNASSIYQELRNYAASLNAYWKKVDAFSLPNGIVDIRKLLWESDRHDICQKLQVLPFDEQQSEFQLSFLGNNRSGWVEPLLPPMRHPDFCTKRKTVMNALYLVHDFVTMCERLKPSSRIVIFDIGASPRFARAASPWFQVVKLYQQFGFKVDHFYAYESKPFTVDEVMKKVPRELHAAYHWINAGVTTTENHMLNPWSLLESEFNEDDLVIVKLDIDNAHLEVPLVHQLLNSSTLSRLVDQFYFEHHVKIKEMKRFWGKSASGSIKDTMELFYQLRMAGVAAHFWL